MKEVDTNYLNDLSLRQHQPNIYGSHTEIASKAFFINYTYKKLQHMQAEVQPSDPYNGQNQGYLGAGAGSEIFRSFWFGSVLEAFSI